jgi:hypothetical protein
VPLLTVDMRPRDWHSSTFGSMLGESENVTVVNLKGDNVVWLIVIFSIVLVSMYCLKHASFQLVV